MVSHWNGSGWNGSAGPIMGLSPAEVAAILEEIEIDFNYLSTKRFESCAAWQRLDNPSLVGLRLCRLVALDTRLVIFKVGAGFVFRLLTSNSYVSLPWTSNPRTSCSLI